MGCICSTDLHEVVAFLSRRPIIENFQVFLRVSTLTLVGKKFRRREATFLPHSIIRSVFKTFIASGCMLTALKSKKINKKGQTFKRIFIVFFLEIDPQGWSWSQGWNFCCNCGWLLALSPFERSLRSWDKMPILYFKLFQELKKYDVLVIVCVLYGVIK
jgi:hypothetical protein